MKFQFLDKMKYLKVYIEIILFKYLQKITLTAHYPVSTFAVLCDASISMCCFFNTFELGTRIAACSVCLQLPLKWPRSHFTA